MFLEAAVMSDPPTKQSQFKFYDEAASSQQVDSQTYSAYRCQKKGRRNSRSVCCRLLPDNGSLSNEGLCAENSKATWPLTSAAGTCGRLGSGAERVGGLLVEGVGVGSRGGGGWRPRLPPSDVTSITPDSSTNVAFERAATIFCRNERPG